MADILGLGLSHYPGPLVPAKYWPDMLKTGVKFGMVPSSLYTDKSQWPESMRKEWSDDGGVSAAYAHRDRLLAGFKQLRAEIDAFKPDLIVIWGDDQYENYKLDCIPPFCVGIHDDITTKPYGGGKVPFGTEENAWGVPIDSEVHWRGHYEAAHGLTTALLTAGFDVSWARTLRSPEGLAHSFGNTLVYLDYDRTGFDYPIVPIHVNCYGNHLVRGGAALAGEGRRKELAPPSPNPARCFALGRATARYFAASPWRVALIGSSSWSHANLTAKNQHFFPDVAADRQRLAELTSGEFRQWGEIPLADIENAGQHEMLNWICLAGAMTELGKNPLIVDFIETWLFNSSKCFAVFPADSKAPSARVNAPAAAVAP